MSKERQAQSERGEDVKEGGPEIRVRRRATAVPEQGRPERRARPPRTVPQRVLHGTRVRFDLTCDRCGAEDSLPFVPKTAGDVLCRVCAADELGPHWAGGREIEAPGAWAFSCSLCGAEDHLPRPPAEPTHLLCRRCLRGEVAAEPERIGGVVLDRAGGVRRMRRRPSAEKSE